MSLMEQQFFQQLIVVIGDPHKQAPIANRKGQAIGPGRAALCRAHRLEQVFLDQIEDGDPPFLLDIGIAPDDRLFIELDMRDAMVARRRC